MTEQDEPTGVVTYSESGDSEPIRDQDPCEQIIWRLLDQKYRGGLNPFGFMLPFFLRELREVARLTPKMPRGRPNKEQITAAQALQQQGKTRRQIAAEIGHKFHGGKLTDQQREALFAGLRMRKNRARGNADSERRAQE